MRRLLALVALVISACSGSSADPQEEEPDPPDPTGPIKVCAGEKCRQLAVEPSVLIEYPDGRFGAGVTPTLLGP